MTNRQNHLARLEQIQKSKVAAGRVSERFPGVSGIVFRMTYYLGAANPVLMERTLNFLPNDYAYFRMECMKEECTNGGFDLAPVVAGLIKSRKKACKGKVNCHGKNSALTPGHASIAYEVSVQYAKQAKS